MSQISSTIPKPEVPAVPGGRRFIPVALIAFAIFVGVAMTIAARPAAVAVPAARSGSADVVDGWEAAMLAAQATRLARIQDGYLPGLLASRQTGDLVDGYLPGLLRAHAADDIMDGWEPGLNLP
jgi:hypothetical protein